MFLHKITTVFRKSAVTRARRTPLRPWDEMVSHVIGTRGDHDIKFVDTCLFFARKFPELAPTAQLAASTLKKK